MTDEMVMDDKASVDLLEDVTTTQSIIAGAKKPVEMVGYNYTGFDPVTGKDRDEAILYNRDVSAKGMNDKTVLK